MGKSRTVDELGKHHFVLPINLRSEGTTGMLNLRLPMLSASTAYSCTGFPPSDGNIRHFLTATRSQDETRRCVYAFLETLFEHTTATLQN